MQARLTSVHGTLLRGLRDTLLTSDDLTWLIDARHDVAALVIDVIEQRPWLSATLSGTRYRLGLRLTGPMTSVEGAADTVERVLETAEFDVAPELVASTAVVEADVAWAPGGNATARLIVEVLTLDGG